MPPRACSLAGCRSFFGPGQAALHKLAPFSPVWRPLGGRCGRRILAKSRQPRPSRSTRVRLTAGSLRSRSSGPVASSSFEPRAEPAEPAELDLSGEVCPYTFVRARLALEAMPLGTRLDILVDHEPATRNIPRSAREWGSPQGPPPGPISCPFLFRRRPRKPALGPRCGQWARSHSGHSGAPIAHSDPSASPTRLWFEKPKNHKKPKRRLVVPQRRWDRCGQRASGRRARRLRAVHSGVPALLYADACRSGLGRSRSRMRH
jgi:TusA-related sulfurtransferase